MDEMKKKAMLRYRILIFASVSIAYFFVYFHRTTGGAISTELQDYYLVGASAVALLASAYLYAYTLMQIPSGLLADRFGPRRIASVFILLIAAGSVLSAYSATVSDFNLMIAGKFIIGIGAAAVTVPTLKIMAVWYRNREFATMNGMMLLIGNIGGIAAAAPMVAMMDSIGIQNTYLVLAGITAMTALLCWVFVRDHPSDLGYPSIEEIVADETGQPVSYSTSEKMPMKQALRTVLSDIRGFWPLAVWFFLMYGTLMVWQASQAGSYYHNVYGYSNETAGMMVSLVGIGVLIGAPLSGIISDRIAHSRRRVVLVGTIFFTAVWGVIFLTAGIDGTESIYVQGTINLLFGFFAAFFVPSFAMVKEKYPVSMAGTSTSILNVFPFAGGAILVTLSGFLIGGQTLQDYQGLWAVMFVLAIVSCVSIFLSREGAVTGI